MGILSKTKSGRKYGFEQLTLLCALVVFALHYGSSYLLSWEMTAKEVTATGSGRQVLSEDDLPSKDFRNNVAAATVEETSYQKTDETINKTNNGKVEMYDGRYEIPKADQLLTISQESNIDEMIENLQKVDIPFLPSYNTPCWFESVRDLDSVYKDSPYTTYRDQDGAVRKGFEDMTTILTQRFRNDGVAWRLRCLPYFYVAGAPRCGTTDIYASLVQHKQIPVTATKESVYWNRVRYMTPSVIGKSSLKSNFSLPVGVRHFLDLFDITAETVRSKAMVNLGGVFSTPPRHRLLIGDMTPSYMYDFDAWRNLPANRDLNSPRYVVADLINQLTPHAKIIFLLRNPVDRLLSDYNFFRVNGRQKTSEDFHRLVEQSLDSFRKCVTGNTFTYCLHDRDTHVTSLPLRLRIGMYEPNIREWYRVFPADQILVLRFEDYVEDKKAILQKIFKFLDVDEMPDEWFEDILLRKPRNKSEFANHLGAMDNSTKALLEEFYAPWNRRLATFLQDEKYLWSQVHMEST